MPSGNRAFRWVKTAPNVWQLEDGRPGSRHFRGCVSVWPAFRNRPAWCSWWVLRSDAGDMGHQGETATRREAMDEVERRVIRQPAGAA